MRIEPFAEGQQLGLARGSAAICVPFSVEDARVAVATLVSLVEHSDVSTPVILAGSTEALERVKGDLVAKREERLLLVLSGAYDTDVEALSAAVSAICPGDVVLVRPGVRVGAGWLEGLRAAALSDSTVASASPLGAGGALGDVDEAERRIREALRPLNPRTATIGPGCAYIRRSALELVGPLEDRLALDDALGRLALRALAAGMVHVLADDVLIEGPAAVDVAPPSGGVHEQTTTVANVQSSIADDERGALRRAVNRVRAALWPLTVTIDARALAAAVGGTQTYLTELVLALARGGGVRVRVLVPPDLSEPAAAAFDAAPAVELISYEQAVAGVRASDVVHRPQQVFTADDLALLRLVGERVVIGQQDLIAYHNHTYHRDLDAWRGYRRTTRLALAGADQVVFFSEHARRDALAEDLLPASRAHVVGIGLQHPEPSSAASGPPAGLPMDAPFLVCLGADYAHKNRPFAIELLSALRELGWPGRLVLAGPHVPYGSSRERERQLLRRHALEGQVLDLGPVDEPRKRWLYAHARALVYPTTYEGFGLLPVEAASAGLPCLFAAQASLAELASDAATLIAWDARASAAAVLPLLSEGPARAEHLGRLSALAAPSWDAMAQRLRAVYEQAVCAPSSEAAPRVWQELDRERCISSLDRDVRLLKGQAQEYQDAYHALEGRVRTGLPLIDDGGLLSHDQQRGLMRVAARGRIGAAVLAPLGMLGRWGNRARAGR